MNPNATAGWMELELARSPNAEISLPAISLLITDAALHEGRAVRIVPVQLQDLPVVGFVIKHRDFNNPAENYVSTVEHAYTRSFAAGQGERSEGQ